MQLPEGRFHMLMHGNALERLRGLPDESVDCVITSPPYYSMRFYRGAESIWGGDPECSHDFSNAVPADLMHENRNNRRGTQEEVMANPSGTTYIRRMRGQAHGTTAQVGNTVEDAQPPAVPLGAFCRCGAWKGQLGLEPSYTLYLDHLLMVTEELKRVLKKSGTLWWNMGDTYAGSGNAHGDSTLVNNPKRKKVAESVLAVPKKADCNIPSKSLMMIPERFAMRMVDEQGWILRNVNIWHKPNHMPASATDRFTGSYEFVFFFTKAQRYYFDLDAVRVPLAFPIRPSGNKERKVEQFTLSHLGSSIPWSPEDSPGNVISVKRSSDEPVLHEHDINKKGHSGYYDKEGNLLVNPNGANPGDVFATKHDEAVGRTSGSYRDPLHTKAYNPNGKNPGDIMGYDSKYTKEDYGQPLQGFIRDQSIKQARDSSRIRAKELFPNDPVKQQEYINFVHDHYTHPYGRNPGDFWSVNLRPHPFAHFAVFPVELCTTPIKAGCPKDGVVLDPFAGSGTVGVAARQLGRSSILIEISDEYCNIIKERMKWGQQSLDGTQWIEV